MSLTPDQSADIATRVFMEDLKLRKGFGELIATIGDWPKIETAMRNKVQAALALADSTEEVGFE